MDLSSLLNWGFGGKRGVDMTFEECKKQFVERRRRPLRFDELAVARAFFDYSRENLSDDEIMDLIGDRGGMAEMIGRWIEKRRDERRVINDGEYVG